MRFDDFEACEDVQAASAKEGASREQRQSGDELIEIHATRIRHALKKCKGNKELQVARITGLIRSRMTATDMAEGM